MSAFLVFIDLVLALFLLAGGVCSALLMVASVLCVFLIVNAQRRGDRDHDLRIFREAFVGYADAVAKLGYEQQPEFTLGDDGDPPAGAGDEPEDE